MMNPGDSYSAMFSTQRFDTGVAVNADALPVATAYRNGVADAGFALTVANVGTGLYKVTGTVPAYTAGDRVEVIVAATVNAVASVLSIDRDRVVAFDPDDAVDLGLTNLDSTISGVLTQATNAASSAATAAATAANVETDTQDIQGRLPTTLSTGRMRSAVEAMDADTVSASALKADAVTEIAGGVWDRLTSALTTVGSVGKYLLQQLAIISTNSVTVTGPVVAGGNVVIVRGDAYLAAESSALSWTDTALIGVTASAAVLWTRNRQTGATWSKTGTWTSGTGTFSVDLTAAETSVLALGQNNYLLNVRLTTAAGKRTPWTPSMSVVDGIA